MSLHVLVVDDDGLARFAMVRSLMQLRHVRPRVLDFERGADALSACAVESFDVGVFDLMMPGLNGVELAREVLVRLPSIRLIFVTADLASVLADEARALLPLGVLPKPWPLPELLALVGGSKGA